MWIKVLNLTFIMVAGGLLGKPHLPVSLIFYFSTNFLLLIFYSIHRAGVYRFCQHKKGSIVRRGLMCQYFSFQSSYIFTKLIILLWYLYLISCAPLIHFCCFSLCPVLWETDLYVLCYGLNVSLQNFYFEALTANVIICGGRVLGR